MIARVGSFIRKHGFSAFPRAVAIAASQARARILDLRLRRAHAKHRQEHVDEYYELAPLIEAYQSRGGVKHLAYEYSLVSLRRLTKTYEPSSILEFGSGGSTAVLAMHATERSIPFVSLEESEHYFEITKDLCRPFVSRHVDLLLVPKDVERDPSGVTNVSYAWEPTRPFDFVFIDGPSFWVDDEEIRDAVNSDIFDLVGDHPPRVIVVDKRPLTVETIQKRLGHLYRTRCVSGLITRDIGRNYDYFSVFELRTRTEGDAGT